ncbi:FtsX-like permease family protein [Paenibacillus thalictri]|uniref:Cell division protein FtsX n=2 Tax=Paenibacillus thalictri TaxID=2527873 RepID=A0A4Q9DNF2_9BACL|nr:FtsX-like permease family protein [Paenibacillus thalictri]
MTMAGVLLLVRAGTGDIMLYLQSQVSMKVYVQPQADSAAIAGVLRQNGFVESAVIETKEQQLQQLSLFFQGKAYLLDSFKDSDMPDAIRLKLKPGTDAAYVADQLRGMKGISDVLFPQQFAETLLRWSDAVNRYGLLLFLFFAAIAFLTVFLAITLALSQRQKEIRVKLLLGAKPWHVRSQFLLEGGIIGLFGSLFALLAIYGLYVAVLQRVAQLLPGLIHVSPGAMYALLLGLLAAGTCIGVAASYFSTGKLMNDA